jgi:ribonuclease P protein component
MRGRFTFSKEERLTGKTSIDRVFNNGKSFSQYPFKVFYVQSDDLAGPAARLLIAIPKKKVRLAVDRNRIRRWVREAYRLNKTGLFACLESIPAKVHLALILTGEPAALTYKEVALKVPACLDKLGRIMANESGKEILKTPCQS